MRKENQALSGGGFLRVETKNKEIFSYIRETKSQKILVINNLSEKSIDSEIHLPYIEAIKIMNKNNFYDLISNSQIPTKHCYKGLLIELKPYQTLYLKL